jgi:hypothetical protein
MFGTNDTTQGVMGGAPTQNPSMLDNVSPQDFQMPQTPVDPATQQQPPVQEFGQDDNAQMPQQALAPAEPWQPPQSSQAASGMSTAPIQDVNPAHFGSASAPVEPPQVDEPSDIVADEQNGTFTEDHEDDSRETSKPIDHSKLADMKRQALEHLEPLADHIDGTPEETFRTTMMMIQANDNHSLLEKALNAAKLIEDDKERAQAMLDIINEINYFSQLGADTNEA